MTDPTHPAATDRSDAHPTPIDPEALLDRPGIEAPTLSPDGEDLAVFRATDDGFALDVLAIDTGERATWTGGETPVVPLGGLLWAPDGDRCYVHVDADGDGAFDIYAVGRDGEAHPVVEPDGRAYLGDVSPDGRYLLYASDRDGGLDLHRHDQETGTDERLTDHEGPVFPHDAAFGPAGERVAYGADETGDPANRDAYVVDPGTGESRRLAVTGTGSEVAVADWFPGGDRLLVFGNGDDVDRVGVYDLAADDVAWLGEGRAPERGEAVSPDGTAALALRFREAGSVPVVYDVATGEGRELDVTGGVVDAVAGRTGGFAAGRTLLLSRETGTRPAEVVRYDRDADESDVVLGADLGGVDSAALVEPEYVTYESTDGLEIGAVLYVPRVHHRGDPAPAVVAVHGGPHRQSRRDFDPMAQALASRGYAVLQPNYRGSTGRGCAFKNRILGDVGGMEQVDVRRGAEWLADRDGIDPDRIAVFGRSYGAYSVYCQLTMHPAPWAAGLAWTGMTDLRAMAEDGPLEGFLAEALGDPETTADLYRERSPVEHVDALDAPIHVVHAADDPRCPVAQARRFRDALETRGLTDGPDGAFEYTELDGSSHGEIPAAQRVRVCEALVDFLGRRL